MPNFFNGEFFAGGFFGAGGGAAVKTGTGGIDPPKRKLHLPYKPTGLLDRPAKTPVDARVEETRHIHEEVSRQLAREFVEPEVEEIEQLEFMPIARMSQEQIDYEIGVLLRKKMRDEEEELMMLLMMVSAL